MSPKSLKCDLALLAPLGDLGIYLLPNLTRATSRLHFLLQYKPSFPFLLTSSNTTATATTPTTTATTTTAETVTATTATSTNASAAAAANYCYYLLATGYYTNSNTNTITNAKILVHVVLVVPV